MRDWSSRIRLVLETVFLLAEEGPEGFDSLERLSCGLDS
jgi:hypothetical protein